MSHSSGIIYRFHRNSTCFFSIFSLFGTKSTFFVLVMKRLNTVSYISQSRLANSLGDKPGQGNP